MQNQSERDRAGARIELFEIDGTPYRIRWEYDKVENVPFQQIRERLEQRGFLHERRLTEAYALEIQQSFSRQLTRIGQQVPPPVLAEMSKAKLYFRSETVQFEFLEEFPDVAACVYHHKENTAFTLTCDCMEWVYDQVANAINEIENRIKSGKNPSESKKRIETLKEVRRQLLPNCEFQIRQTKLPKEDKFIVWPQKMKTKTPLFAVHNANALTGNWKGEGVVAICFTILSSRDNE